MAKRRVIAVVSVAAALAGGCTSDLDTTRQPEAEGSFGQTMYQELAQHYTTFSGVREKLISLSPGLPNGQTSDNP